MSNFEPKTRYGLLGSSLSHSFSQAYFSKKIAEQNINASYDNFEIQAIEDFPSLCDRKQLAGLNVTIPYKEQILTYLDELSVEAEKIGAVNTIVFDGARKIGHNTDAFGFQQMIKPFLLHTHERALILGNGGAAKAVTFVLKNIGLDVLIAARHPKASEFHLDEVNDLMVKHCGVIVNTTPVGTYPRVDDFLPLPFSAIHAGHLVVDLIYNPEETQFLNKAKNQGATTLNGLTMLYQQAEKSWELWNQKV
jgi:shikimate dehydrogenase